MARFNDKNVMLMGLKGKDGLSAYEIAVKNGFEGTEEEWLESLLPPTNLENGEGENSLQQKGTTANHDNQVTLGRFNDNKTDTLVEVGNGTGDENRSNAFEVYKDGRAKVYGAPKEDEDVVRKKELATLVTKEEVSELKDDISVVNAILAQSGLVSEYKETIEDTYTDRVTADGANVADGSKAILEKVVGNTIAYDKDENGMNGKLANASFAGIESGGKNRWNGTWEVGGITTSNGEDAVSSASLRSSYVEVTSGVFVFSGNIGSRYGFTYDENKKFVCYLGLNFAIVTLTDKEKYIRVMQYNSTVEPTNIQLEHGTTATEYTPYIEPTTLDFPKTETPLGTTIDFENKKITDYGVNIVLTGTEVYSTYNSQVNGVTRNGVYVSVLPNVENNNQNGVTTDGIITNEQKENSILIGAGNKILYWVGILDLLGFTTEGTQATGEEARTAIANFKAYLAQRYADGNPVTIRYVSSTVQSETEFTEDQKVVGNEYTAYNGGTEKVIGNDNAEYGAENTLSQNYIIVNKVD